MFWILLGVALVLFVYFALIRPFKYWTKLGVPESSVWILWRETFLTFTQYREITDAIKLFYNAFPGHRYYGLYQFYRPLLILKDPDLIKQITVKDFDHFVDHTQVSPEIREPLLEKNLVSLKGDKWRHMRAILSPSFTGSKMKVMFGSASECAKQVVRYFEEQNSKVISLEMKDVFTRFTNDVIASAAFGVTIDSMTNRDNDFYLMGKEVTNFQGFWRIMRLLLLVLSPKLAKVFGITIFDNKVSSYFTRLVKDNIETREREGIVRQDMIHLLMEARKERSKNEMSVEDIVNTEFAIVDDSPVVKEEKPRKEQLTIEDIVAQAFVFFSAGFEPVSMLMCFMAHELAVNPDIQERLQYEIDDTLSDCEGSITYEALSKMKYMDMVVSETLRKWPTAILLDRICVKPYTIPALRKGERPVHLKQGDTVWVPIFACQRDPQLYPEPERFDPDRFSDENKSSVAPYTFLPFGVGPRSCIGNRFALMETKLVFFHLLSKFDLTVDEKTTVPLKLAKLQLTAKDGFWLGLSPRKVVA